VQTVAVYATALGIGALGLQWLEFRYVTRAFSTELYIGVVAALFVALGVWVGQSLTPRARQPDFQCNEAAISSLGLTPRECEILAALVSGQSNKELARALDIAPDTVKTHLSRIYDKLGVSRRVQAIEKARSLSVIP
jgi:DNA-binding CsgD family transcriptional regulator